MQQEVDNSPGSVPQNMAARLRFGHYCLLALPYFGLLFPGLYARRTPEFYGIPFFYAYQFGWVFLSAGLTAVVYRSITRKQS